MRKLFSIITLIAGIFVATTAHAECTSDQYAVGDTCYSCPANASCDGVNFTCIDGFYRNLAVCSACPPNSTCTSPTDFTCNPGSYLQDGVCATCPANATCTGGDAYFHCNDGYYKLAVSCLSCDHGICENETLISCDEGYFHYSRSGTSCNKCDAAQYCPAGTTDQTMKCIEGYYSAEYHCNKCPDEYYCPHLQATINNYKQFCAPGYYQNGDGCIACTGDMVCPGFNVHVCPDGLFWHDDGVCRDYQQGTPGTYPNCNPGYYDNGTECVACVENSICTSASDFSCMAGYYASNGACNKCPNNATCAAGSNVPRCIDGYYLNTNSTCSRCSGGYYCNNNTRYSCPPYVDGSLDDVLPPGDTVVSVAPNVTSWASSGLYTVITNCRINGDVLISNDTGMYALYAPIYDGTRYYPAKPEKLWVSANTGYYLSRGYTYSNTIYYNRNNPCTNKPEHSEYIGAGAPDSNNCPWQCDDGYYRDGDTCAVCPDGMNCLGGTIVCPAGEYPDVSVCRTCTNKPDHSAYTGPGTPAGNDCAFTCDAGYYYDGSSCVICDYAHYCPGDNSRYDCPNAEQHARTTFLPQFDDPTMSSPNVVVIWLHTTHVGASAINRCLALGRYSSSRGMWYDYSYYNPETDEYDSFYSGLWYGAKPGNYLTSKPVWATDWCTNNNLYYKQNNICPENHYCPGFNMTPCSPENPVPYLVNAGLESCPESHPLAPEKSTSQTDCYKTCPDIVIEHGIRKANPTANYPNECEYIAHCDDGYGRTIDEMCELLCPTDIKLRADGGISINIYANRLSDPSLNILYQDVLCYVRMVPGKKVGTLNTEYNGAQYYFSN